MGNYHQESHLEYRGKPARNGLQKENEGIIAKGRGPTMQKVIRDAQTKSKLATYKTSR